MLATHVDIKQQDWASLLPFVQLAYNTVYSPTLQETPSFLMFGREARLPVDIIIGLPQASQSIDSHDNSHNTQANLQVAYEPPRRNLGEKIENKQSVNQTRTAFPVFKPGQQFLLYLPIARRTDRILSCTVLGEDRTWCSPKFRPSCIEKKKARADAREILVHLAHLKP